MPLEPANDMMTQSDDDQGVNREEDDFWCRHRAGEVAEQNCQGGVDKMRRK